MRATALPGTANSRRSSGITASAVGAKGWPSRRFTVSTLVDWADDVEVRKQGTNNRAMHEAHNRCADILMLPIRGDVCVLFHMVHGLNDSDRLATLRSIFPFG